jgi:DNA-binding transcriptional MerR regulator
MPKTAASPVPATVPIRSDAAVTIGKLARAAEVGVETVRYYQRRRLLAVPQSAGGVRRYPLAAIDRIRFIKRSQDLGFSLEEIRELLRLERGGSRSAIRKIAGDRLANIRARKSQPSGRWSGCFPNCSARASTRLAEYMDSPCIASGVFTFWNRNRTA